MKGLLLLAAIASAAAPAAAVTLQSGAAQTGVLELYTSEGCSSCPPADRWVSGLREHPGLWSELIPLAFHVDYWDYIGWPDRFASRHYSERQRRYAREADMRTVYTPGLFYNGAEWRGWFGRPSSNFPPPARSGVLRLVVEGEDLAVSFVPQRELRPPLRVQVALLGFDLSTEVGAGENRGRSLRHDFVVLGLSSAALIERGSEFVASLALPTAQLAAPRYAVAAWVSDASGQAPLQAVGGWLPR